VAGKGKNEGGEEALENSLKDWENMQKCIQIDMEGELLYRHICRLLSFLTRQHKSTSEYNLQHIKGVVWMLAHCSIMPESIVLDDL
jgi:hypothetical protein